MSWQLDHIIELFKGWWKNANQLLWFWVNNVENALAMEFIFRYQFRILVMLLEIYTFIMKNTTKSAIHSTSFSSPTMQTSSSMSLDWLLPDWHLVRNMKNISMYLLSVETVVFKYVLCNRTIQLAVKTRPETNLTVELSKYLLQYDNSD